MQKDKYLTNEKIRDPNVLVVDENGTNLGAMNTKAATRLAQDKGLDLVLFVPSSKTGKLSICKIIDYGKFKYQQDVKQKEATPFLLSLIESTRRMAIQYPQYLKPRYKNNKSFSQQEVDFLSLLQQGKSYEDIAKYFFISVNTVRYHIKKIYYKLDSQNANQAVWNAKLLGLIK